MKKIFFVLISICLMGAGEVPDALKSDMEVLSQQGSLVSVKVVKGDPVRIYVLGREEAQVDLSGFNLEIDPSDLSVTVKRVSPKSPLKILRLKREKNIFTVEDAESGMKLYTLEVTTQVKDKKETFKFKIDNRPK